MTRPMKNLMFFGPACSLLLSFNSTAADTALSANSKKVSAVEYLYADVSDANTILATIDSGLLSSYQGKDRAAWAELYTQKRTKLAKELEGSPTSGLTVGDTRAVAAMRKQMTAFTGGGAISSPPVKCEDAARKDIAYPQLKSALVACFVEIGNSLSFEDAKINRVSALNLLHETSDPGRRKMVFLAFVPLWQALNGNNEPDSPYRRMIAGAADEAAKHGSEIDNAARDVGIDSTEVESWLLQTLDIWRESSGDVMVEPWGLPFPSGARPTACPRNTSRGNHCSRSTTLTTAIWAQTWSSWEHSTILLRGRKRPHWLTRNLLPTGARWTGSGGRRSRVCRGRTSAAACSY